MSTYVIFDVDIRDPARYQEFMKGVKPALEAAGGRHLARGGALKVYEGDWAPRHRPVGVFVGRSLGRLLQQRNLPGPEVDSRRMQLCAADVGGGARVNDLTPLRMTDLGSSSVGLGIAASFAQAGQSVTLLARGATVPLLREHGITVTGVCGDHRIGPDRLRVCDADESDPQDIGCDALIVATKAYQVADVLKRLVRNAAAAVAPNAALLLQNGWDSADEAHAALPTDVPVFSSIMMIGIERRSPTHVNVNVQASPIRVGTLFQAAPEAMKEAVARTQAGFLPITYDDEIEPAILNKSLFNTCLNAIGAITRMTYGELVSNEHARHLITQVADETIRVILAERQLALAPNGATYVEKTLTPFVLPKAAAHRSSMLQDVEAGRRTEVDYLNGAVVRIGQGRGIPTPANGAVASLVRARES